MKSLNDLVRTRNTDASDCSYDVFDAESDSVSTPASSSSSSKGDDLSDNWIEHENDQVRIRNIKDQGRHRSYDVTDMTTNIIKEQNSKAYDEQASINSDDDECSNESESSDYIQRSGLSRYHFTDDPRSQGYSPLLEDTMYSYDLQQDDDQEPINHSYSRRSQQTVGTQREFDSRPDFALLNGGGHSNSYSRNRGSATDRLANGDIPRRTFGEGDIMNDPKYKQNRDRHLESSSYKGVVDGDHMPPPPTPKVPQSADKSRSRATVHSLDEDGRSSEPIVYQQNCKGESNQQKQQEAKANKKKKQKRNIRAEMSSQEVEGYRGKESIEVLLDFIENAADSKKKKTSTKKQNSVDSTKNSKKKGKEKNNSGEKIPEKTGLAQPATALKNSKKIVTKTPPPLASPQESLPDSSDKTVEPVQPSTDTSSADEEATSAMQPSVLPPKYEDVSQPSPKDTTESSDKTPTVSPDIDASSPTSSCYMTPLTSDARSLETQFVFTDFEHLEELDQPREEEFAVVKSKKQLKEERIKRKVIAKPEERPYDRNREDLDRRPPRKPVYTANNYSCPVNPPTAAPAISDSKSSNSSHAASTDPSPRSVSKSNSPIQTPPDTEPEDAHSRSLTRVIHRIPRPLDASVYQDLLQKKMEEFPQLQQDVDACQPYHSQIVNFLRSLV